MNSEVANKTVTQKQQKTGWPQHGATPCNADKACLDRDETYRSTATTTLRGWAAVPPTAKTV